MNAGEPPRSPYARYRSWTSQKLGTVGQGLRQGLQRRASHGFDSFDEADDLAAKISSTGSIIFNFSKSSGSSILARVDLSNFPPWRAPWQRRTDEAAGREEPWGDGGSLAVAPRLCGPAVHSPAWEVPLGQTALCGWRWVMRMMRMMMMRMICWCFPKAKRRPLVAVSAPVPRRCSFLVLAPSVRDGEFYRFFGKPLPLVWISGGPSCIAPSDSTSPI